ncbi:MAG: hypothetical protein NZ701_01935 [Roseiflexus sp.]|nr:hypothetical protein [Roseiflexus sp.]
MTQWARRALAHLLEQGVASAEAITLLEAAHQAGALDEIIALADAGAVRRLLERGMTPQDIVAHTKELTWKRVRIIDGLLRDKGVLLHIALDAARRTRQIDEMLSESQESQIIQVKNWTGLDGKTEPTVTDLAYQLVTSERLRSAPGFRKFLEDVKDEIKQGQVGLRTQLEEAARRAHSKKREVALEKWQLDGKTYYGDIINITARQALQVKAVTSADPGKVMTRIREAGAQLRGETKPPKPPPPGFTRIIDVRILNPANAAAQVTSAAGLLSLLREWNLKPHLHLAEVDKLLVKIRKRHDDKTQDVVFTITRKAEAITSPDPQQVVAQMKSAADRIRDQQESAALPESVTGIIEVRILDRANPIAQATSVEALLRLLREHGLHPRDLAGVDELIIKTPDETFTIPLIKYKVEVIASPDPEQVVTQLRNAAAQLRRAPEAEAPPEWVTHPRIAEVLVQNPDNPIAQATSVADLLRLLQEHGLHPHDLAGVDELRVTTPRGSFTIDPAKRAPAPSAGP